MHGAVAERLQYKELTPSIIRREFPAVTTWDPLVVKRMAMAQLALTNTALANDVSLKLSNNLYAGFEHLGNFRPQSAYFLLDNDVVTVDLCKKTPDGKIKHEFMREENGQYSDQSFYKNPDKLLLSGHMGPLNLPSLGTIDVALIDAFRTKAKSFSPQDQEYGIVATLYANRIIPVTGGGFPVKLEQEPTRTNFEEVIWTWKAK